MKQKMFGGDITYLKIPQDESLIKFTEKNLKFFSFFLNSSTILTTSFSGISLLDTNDERLDTILILSRKSKRCGEVYRPVFKPKPAKLWAQNLAVEPLPLVPAIWITLSF